MSANGQQVGYLQGMMVGLLGVVAGVQQGLMQLDVLHQKLIDVSEEGLGYEVFIGLEVLANEKVVDVASLLRDIELVVDHLNDDALAVG